MKDSNEKESRVEMPTSVAVEKALYELVEKINEISEKYRFPYYLLNDIVEKIHLEIQQQIQFEKKYYQDILREKENQKEEGIDK